MSNYHLVDTSIPRSLLALFGACRERATIPERRDQRFLVAETPLCKIEFVGDGALNMDDLIVLLVCMVMSRKAGGIGERVALSLNECNRYLWKSKSGTNNARFVRSLKRLHQGYIQISSGGSLVERRRLLADLSIDSDALTSGVRMIRVDPQVASWMFDADDMIDVVGMAQQAQFPRWLWWYYSTRDVKRKISVIELQGMSGSSHLPLFKFRAKLRDALKALTTATTIVNEAGEKRTIPPLFAPGATITKDDRLHVVLTEKSIPDTAVDAGVARMKRMKKSRPDDDAPPPILVPPSRRRVFVVTTSSVVSDGFIDFQTRLARFGNAIDGVVRMKPAKKDQDNTRHLARAILQLAEEHKPGTNDIVAIVRGGGDADQFTMFNAPVSIDAIEALRNNGVFVIAGVGHTKDHWDIHAHVDHAAEVPFAAAEFVNRLIDLEKNRPTIAPKRPVFPHRRALHPVSVAA